MRATTRDVFHAIEGGAVAGIIAAALFEIFSALLNVANGFPSGFDPLRFAILVGWGVLFGLLALGLSKGGTIAARFRPRPRGLAQHRARGVAAAQR
jgi:hypothetical protein